MIDEIKIKQVRILVFRTGPIRLLISGDCSTPGVSGASLENADEIKKFLRKHHLYDSNSLINRTVVVEHDGTAGCTIKLIGLK